MRPKEIDDLLTKMEQEDMDQRTNQLSREKRWRSIPKETGQFLFQLVSIAQPKKIIEIGMSHGYSTLWLALAASNYGGKVFSYEISEWRYNQAIQNFAEANMMNIIDANLVTPEFRDYPSNIDFVFIDAEKEDYNNHFTNIASKLNDHALVVADNVISHKESLQEYIQFLQSSDQYYSITTTIGKGLEITRKIS